MKKILLANDDGYTCAGYFPLLDALSKKYDVTAIAPSTQRSWVGKSLSAHHPIKYSKVQYEGHDVYAIEGTPADCVQIGLYNLMDSKPDIVLSGINDGENIGHGRILSSGTIGAAMEGAIDGVLSVTASLCDTKNRDIDYFDPANYHYFENAAAIVVKIIDILESVSLGPDVHIISINIPFDAKPTDDIEVVVPYTDPYGQLFVQEGDSFKHKGAPVRFENLQDGTDLKAIFEGRIAITPINLNLASKETAQKLNSQMTKLWT